MYLDRQMNGQILRKETSYSSDLKNRFKKKKGSVLKRIGSDLKQITALISFEVLKQIN